MRQYTSSGSIGIGGKRQQDANENVRPQDHMHLFEPMSRVLIGWGCLSRYHQPDRQRNGSDPADTRQCAQFSKHPLDDTHSVILGIAQEVTDRREEIANGHAENEFEREVLFEIAECAVIENDKQRAEERQRAGNHRQCE